MKQEKNLKLEDYLKELPSVFSYTEFHKFFNEKSKEYQQLLMNRMKKKGLIEPVGQRTGLYFNKFRFPDGKDEIKALYYIYPEAVLTGAYVLLENSWTTQIPKTKDVIVLKDKSYPKIFGYDILPRNKSWYKKMLNFISKDENGVHSFKPEAVLIDLLKYRDSWIPDPDDLDLNKKQKLKLIEASHNLNYEIPDEYFNYLELNELLDDLGIKKEEIVAKKNKNS